MTQQTVGHWIADKQVTSNSGLTAPVYDPALGVVTRQVALANESEINAAIAAAKEAFATWKDVPQAKPHSKKPHRTPTKRYRPHESAAGPPSA
jgi:malonate-semialdehyde dehydrogenase (acetylating)/methylmalonate-semialdehyde dehydrogenase